MNVNTHSFTKRILLLTIFTSVLIPPLELFKIVNSPIYYFTFLKDLFAILSISSMIVYFFLLTIQGYLNKLFVFQGLLFFIILFYNVLNGAFNGVSLLFVFNELRLQIIYLSLTFLIPTILVFFYTKDFEVKLAKVYINALLITAFVGILEFLVFSKFDFYYIIHNAIMESGKGIFDNRIFSTLLNPNTLSQALLASLIFFFTVFSDLRSRMKNIFCFFILFIALLLTQSKTGLINFVLFLFFFSFLRQKNFKVNVNKLLKVFCLFVIPALIGLVVFISLNIDYFTYRLNGNFLGTLAERLFMWNKLFSDVNLFSGCGIGFIYQSHKIVTLDSGIIKILLEGGLLNLFLYSSFYIIPLICYKWNIYHLYYLLTIAIYFLSNITIPAIWIYPLALHFNFVFGFLIFKIICQDEINSFSKNKIM